MKYKTITYKKKGKIANIIIELARLNCSTCELFCEELIDACKIINQDDTLNVIVIKIMGKSPLSQAGDEEPSIYEAVENVSRIEKIVFAVIDGDAIGESLELALACDIRIASDRSSFALLNVTKGTIPSSGGTQRLPRLVGQAKALELILSGDTIDAEEALRIGLVQEIVSFRNINTEVDSMVSKIADKAPVALQFCKEAVNKGMDLTLVQGVRLEADLYFLIQTTKDRMEGINAFLEKRPPVFKGE